MKISLIIFLVLVCANLSKAQNFTKEKQAQIDSLNTIINSPPHDTSLASAYVELSKHLAMSNIDTMITLCQQAKVLAEEVLATQPSPLIKKSMLSSLAEAINNIGYIYMIKGEVQKALEYMHESLKVFEELGNKKGIAAGLNNIGYIYKNKGEIQKGLEYYQKSLKIKEELGDKDGIANSLNNIAMIYNIQGEIQKALKYLHKSLKIEEELGDKPGIAASLNNIGFIHESQGETQNALDYYDKSLRIQQELGDKQGIASGLNNIGSIYNNQGGVRKGLEYLHKSLRIREELGDKNGIAESLSNIGTIYDSQGETIKALEYYYKSLRIREELGDKIGIGNSLNNIGDTYLDQGEIQKGLKYFLQSLKIHEELGDKIGMAISLKNIGSIYYERGEFQKGLEYYHKSLEISEELGDKKGIAHSLHNIGSIYYKKGNFSASQNHAKKSMAIAQELGYPDNIKYAANLLYRVYNKTHKYKDALANYELYIQMRDSITNESTQKAAIKQNMQYEYEKQKAVDDAQHDKQLAIEQEQKKKQETITYSVGGGLALVVVFLVFVFNRLRVTRKQKNIIERQKEEVEKQKDVIEIAQKETERQKEVIEEAHKEITDSINYAKRIQSAILPPLRLVKEYLAESFIIYKPKDVVAGDFYWLEPVGDPTSDGSLFAVADCTGHGVPGAIVSVVCNNALNRAVREYGETEPGKVLDKVREIVVQEFEKSEEEVKDGMDIALCLLNGTTLKYAGANNPLWIVRNGVVLETKATKEPIGKYDVYTTFTTHTIQLEKGDGVYIFSDGYVDQFGGPKGKKFKSKAFRALLISIQDKPMNEQLQLLDTAFEEWKGELEQIDDVCIIGVKV